MKRIHFLPVALILCACRGDRLSDLQRIDQIVNIYIKDSHGKDLLNSSGTGTFHSVVFKDIGGLTDQTTINGSWVKTDGNSVKYLQYISGATRNLTDSISSTLKNYRSDIRIELTRSTADSVDVDTLSIFYEWTPEVFQVKRLEYNRELIFTKSGTEANTATVVK